MNHLVIKGVLNTNIQKMQDDVQMPDVQTVTLLCHMKTMQTF